MTKWTKTIDITLDVATESLVLYRAERFDIRGKELLKTQQKYYLADSGFRNVVLGLVRVMVLGGSRRGRGLYL